MAWDVKPGRSKFIMFPAATGSTISVVERHTTSSWDETAIVRNTLLVTNSVQYSVLYVWKLHTIYAPPTWRSRWHPPSNSKCEILAFWVSGEKGFLHKISSRMGGQISHSVGVNISTSECAELTTHWGELWAGTVRDQGLEELLGGRSPSCPLLLTGNPGFPTDGSYNDSESQKSVIFLL